MVARPNPRRCVRLPQRESLARALPTGHRSDGRGLRDAGAVAKSLARCTADFRLLDQALSGRGYLDGEAISLADIPAGTALYRYFELDIERPSVPNVEAWYRRLRERPAYRARVMLPFDELRGRLDP